MLLLGLLVGCSGRKGNESFSNNSILVCVLGYGLS